MTMNDEDMIMSYAPITEESHGFLKDFDVEAMDPGITETEGESLFFLPDLPTSSDPPPFSSSSMSTSSSTTTTTTAATMMPDVAAEPVLSSALPHTESPASVSKDIYIFDIPFPEDQCLDDLLRIDASMDALFPPKLTKPTTAMASAPPPTTTTTTTTKKPTTKTKPSKKIRRPRPPRQAKKTTTTSASPPTTTTAKSSTPRFRSKKPNKRSKSEQTSSSSGPSPPTKKRKCTTAAAATPAAIATATEAKVARMFVEKRDADILMGRGGRSNHHAGNQTYLEKVQTLRSQYKNLGTNQEKTKLSLVVLDWVKQVQKGRFLELDRASGKWYTVTDQVARKKISQALRDGN